MRYAAVMRRQRAHILVIRHLLLVQTRWSQNRHDSLEERKNRQNIKHDGLVSLDEAMLEGWRYPRIFIVIPR